GLEYYSVPGAERLRDALPSFEGGRVVFGVRGAVYSGRPAPLREAFRLKNHLVRGGLGDRTEFRARGPMAAPVPLAKGVTEAVADDIIGKLRGTGPGAPFDGAGNCYIEFGAGRVGKVEANFLGGPKPTGKLVGPSRELAEEKAAFGSSRRERWFAG